MIKAKRISRLGGIRLRVTGFRSAVAVLLDKSFALIF